MTGKKRANDEPGPIWCELSTASGLGDRLLDAFAACTIAHVLHRPLHLHVLPQGLSYQGFIGDYDWSSIELPNCKVLYQKNARLRGFQITPRSYFGLRGDRLILRHERRWATTTLRELCADRGHYAPGASEADFRNAYMQVLSESRVRAQRTLPMGKYVGVHVRRKDKITERSINFHDMSPETFQQIEQRLLVFMDALLKGGRRDIFLCGDDVSYNTELGEKLSAKGAEVLVSNFTAIEDHACLGCCSMVVQCTLYSTFSLTAAMMAQVPLINFTEVHKTMLGEWIADGVLQFEEPVLPVPLPRDAVGVPREWMVVDELSALARNLLDRLIAANLAPETVPEAFKQVYAPDVFSESADSGFLRVGTICGSDMLTRATCAFLDQWKVLGCEVHSLAALPPQHGKYEVIAHIEVTMVAKDRGGRARSEAIVRNFKIDLASKRIVHEKTFLLI